MAKTLDEAGVKRLIQEIKGANKNLNTPIPISRENTTESMAQNVKNIADYVEKAKAAGITNVNGMAVTCIIDEDYSGVGYLYRVVGGSFWVSGIITYDDASNPTVFIVNDGTYTKSELVNRSSDQITSDMLVKGARKPIRITGDMTEVDEETYQKLLSGDVDVIADFGEGNFIEPQARFNSEEALILYFGYSQFNESSEGVIATYTISINTSAPHTLKAAMGLCGLVPSDLVFKDTLSSILEEIDLTGTDAERKAKLDQFEIYWKALTGADDLSGARFVGLIDVESGLEVIFSYNASNGYWSGLNKFADGVTSVTISPLDGSLTITPLFSHLEAITIYTDNTPEHMQANLDNIAAYKANLQALGVDTNNNHIIPIKFDEVDDEIGTSFPFGGFITTYGGYEGFVTSTLAEGYKPRHIWISQAYGDEGKVTLEELAYNSELDNYTLKSLNSKSLEAITIKTGNTPEDKAANVAAIKAYEDNLEALGFDMTKGYMIPITASGRNGFLSTRKGDYPYAGYASADSSVNDFYNILILGNGEYYDSKIQPEVSNELNTISRKLVPAINEVNALAKGYSTIFTPIELTTDPAQNKTAIDARVAAFTAQGISLTNGCCIPVTYKGVYAGNISLINGDWYGLLVKNTNNPADNINIKLSADGTITESNSAQ